MAVSVGASVVVGEGMDVGVALAVGVLVFVGGAVVDVANATARSEGVADGWLVRVGCGNGFVDVGIGRFPTLKLTPERTKIIVKINGNKANIHPVNRLGPKPKKRKVMIATVIANTRCNKATNRAPGQIWS